MADENEKQPEITKPIEVQAECPACKHKFGHKIANVFERAGESLGNAIGESKFGGD